MSCSKYQDLMVDALYGELEPELARELEAHVAACEECTALRNEMRSTLAVMNERRRPDPGEEYWQGYYARLEERMRRETSVVDGARDAARRRSNVSWGYRVAAAVAVLAAGVWIGRSTMTPPGPGQPDITVAENAPVDTSSGRSVPADSVPSRVPQGEPRSDRDAIDGPPSRTPATRTPAEGNVQLASADQRAREYIERSQVLLLALVNSAVDSTAADSQRFALQQERAGMLVQEASVLREDLPGSDNRRLRELVTSLQMILREIANLETQNDFDAVEIIRNRVDREGVLLQIDVEQMRDEDAKKEPERGGAID
jgi:hypothetical protein